MLKGRCFCGFVRYEAGGAPSHETICHCAICRRTSGAPCVAWFTVARRDFRFVVGEPASFGSSEHGRRTFCPRCGTHLTFSSSRSPDEIDVTTCSLEDPAALPPRDHTFASSKLDWIEIPDDLESYPKSRS